MQSGASYNNFMAGFLANRRVVRFLVVGGFNTAFSYGIYAAALWVGLPYFSASLLSIVLGILVSFRTQGQLVFGGGGDPAAFARFVLCWGFLYGVNVAFLWLMQRVGFTAYAAGALAIAPMAALSYLLQRHYVFKAKS